MSTLSVMSLCYAMLRMELSLESLKLSYKRKNDFVESKWFSVPVVITYRCFLAAVCLTWIVYNTAVSPPIDARPFFFLTNWGYTVMTGYFVLSTTVTVVHYAQERSKPQHQRLVNQDEFLDDNVKEDDEISVEDEMEWYYRLTWILYNIASNLALCVTLSYWTLIYDGNAIGVSDVFVHILNSIFMVLETVLSSVPIHILHLVYPFVFGLVYTLASLLFWAFIDKTPLYSVLNYSRRPGLAVGILVGTHFIIVPTVQVLLYSLYRLRNYLSTKYSERLD